MSGLSAIALALLVITVAHAQEKVVATVNGKPITEADLRFAEAEIGSEIAGLGAEHGTGAQAVDAEAGRPVVEQPEG